MISYCSGCLQYSYIGNDCNNAIESMPVPTFDDKTVWKQHLTYLLIATLLVETALAFCIIIDYCILKHE